MYFRFACEKCGKKLKVDEEHAGQKARCPYCRTTQVIPSPHGDEEEAKRTEWADRAAASSAPGPAAGSAPPAASDEPPAPEPSKEKAKSSLWDRLIGEASNTDVSAWKSGLLGLWLTGLVYLVLYRVHDSIGALFYHRGWVPVVLTLLLGWAFGIIILKYFKLQRQRDAMLFDVLPNEIGEDITTKNLPNFVNHVRELPVSASQSFFINRVLLGLEHFRVRQNANEVGTVLQSQSEIDNNALASSYSLLNVFLWAIPILGFIGTVLGISTAVASFSGTVAEAGQLADMKQSLGSVMGGLGTAFDTTLLALCMAVVLIFPMKSMQKAEENLLNWVDEYTNENLLKRLKDSSKADSDQSANQQQIQKAINDAMADHHAELRSWRKKLESISENFRQKAEDQWQQIHQRLMEEHETREKSLAQTVDSVTEKQTEAVRQLSELQEQLNQLQDKQAQSINSVNETVQSVQQHVQGLQEGIGSLNEVLRELDGKTVNVQKPKRGLFGRTKQNDH
jgi:biopolymer transport protein ExbB/TolQ/phage FluMu protein Com